MHRSLQTPRKIAGCVRGRKPPRRTRQLARTRTPRTKFGQESFRAAGNAVSHCTSVQGGSLHTPPCKLLSGLPISSDRCPSVRTGWYRRSVASSRPVTGESTKTRRGRSPRPAPRPPPAATSENAELVPNAASTLSPGEQPRGATSLRERGDSLPAEGDRGAGPPPGVTGPPPCDLGPERPPDKGSPVTPGSRPGLREGQSGGRPVTFSETATGLGPDLTHRPPDTLRSRRSEHGRRSPKPREPPASQQLDAATGARLRQPPQRSRELTPGAESTSSRSPSAHWAAAQPMGAAQS